MEKMRISNTFNPFTPKEQDPFQMLEKFRMMNPEPPPMIQQIGQSMMEPQQPMNTRFMEQIDPYKQAQLDLASRKLESAERIAGGNQDIKKSQLGISEQRNKIAEFKAQNPSMKLLTPGDGHVYAVHPVTGAKIDMGIDTLSDQDKLEFQRNTGLENIAARGYQDRTTEGVRQQGRETLADMKARHTKELKEVEAGESKALLPTQQAKNFQVKYNTLINERPDLRKFVSLNEDGMPVIKQVGEKGLTQVDYDYINKFIFGTKSKDVNLPAEKLVSSHESTVKDDSAKKAADLIARYGKK